MSVIVSLATNDDHGNSTGRVSAVEVGGAIELEWAGSGVCPRYSIQEGVLRLSRGKFRIGGVREWYGTMCWTGVAMGNRTAAALLNYLSKEARWHCGGDLCDLTDAYDKGQVTEQLLKGLQP